MKSMGRVFAISFDFRKQTHVAIVTVNYEPADLTYYAMVRLFDHGLQQIIPDGKFEFTSTDHSLPIRLPHPWAEELFICVKQATSLHLSIYLSTGKHTSENVPHNPNDISEL